MPFIRYKVEDRALQSSIDQCGCDRGYSLIEHITGRFGDRLVTPSGSYIHAEYFWYKLMHFPDIKEYQIVQHIREKIVILIVGDSNRLKDDLELLKQQMMNEIDEGIEIQIKYVDYIEKTKTGKYQFVISKVGKLI
jgi:phenylacetate-CoA ligase